MNLLLIILVGGTAAMVARRVAKRRWYGPVDDLLWGVLGALLGDSLAGQSGFTFEISAACMVLGAAGLLSVTGLVKIEEYVPHEAAMKSLFRAQTGTALPQAVADAHLEHLKSSRGVEENLTTKAAA